MRVEVCYRQDSGVVVSTRMPGGHLTPAEYLELYESDTQTLPSQFDGTPQEFRDRKLYGVNRQRWLLRGMTDVTGIHDKLTQKYTINTVLLKMAEMRTGALKTQAKLALYGLDSVWGHMSKMVRGIIILDLTRLQIDALVAWRSTEQLEPSLRVPYERMLSAKSVDDVRDRMMYVEIPRHLPAFVGTGEEPLFESIG